MFVASWCFMCFCVVLYVGLCTSHYVMVPLNLAYLHCLRHPFFKDAMSVSFRSILFTSYILTAATPPPVNMRNCQI